jgi:hypothetical protein
MKVAFLITTLEEQDEGLRSSLGLLIENHDVSMVVLNHEVQMSENYRENLEWFLDMDGNIYSNVPKNDKYGFKPLDLDELGAMLKEVDYLVSF